MKFGIGQSTARVEDRRLLTGAGCYSDDIAPGQGLHVAFLRAPYAHAHLLNIDLEAARQMDGVHLVATQADLDADQIGDVLCQYQPPLIGGGKMQLVSKPAMVRDINRHAGDVVAMVVADRQETADSAIELIVAEFEPMPAVTDIYEAIKEGKDVKKLPMSLGEALEALEADEVVQRGMPGEMYRLYHEYKSDEWARFMSTVTDWDSDTYMECLP